ncbi:MAG: ABC transporter permease [Phycisphaerae bacterium]
MTRTYILLQNLRRNRLRTGLTLAAFALPMVVFVLAISFVVVLVQVLKANAKELRLGVHHKTTLINLLPEGQRAKIESLDPERQRLVAVCGMRWFGGKLPNEKQAIQSLAADADTFPVVYSDAGLTPEEIEAWNRDRTACVLGQGIVDMYGGRYEGFRVGGRITLRSTVPPYLQLEFKVVKVMDNPTRANVFYFRRDYMTEGLKALGDESPRCNIFWVKCKGVEALHSLQADIDKQFANSPDETKTEDENTFAANFTQALGNLPGLMQAMAIVVMVIIGLVAGNTMMMSFRERTRELAVFKAIGFSSGRIFRIVLAESVSLALIGALIGVLLSVLVIPLLLSLLRSRGFLPFSNVGISVRAVAASLLIAMAIGLLAGLWPAYQALHLRTVDALRRAV